MRACRSPSRSGAAAGRGVVALVALLLALAPDPGLGRAVSTTEPGQDGSAAAPDSVLQALLDGHLTRRFRIGSLSGPDAFGLVESVAVDSAGRIYVLDSLNRRVRIYTPEGELLTETGGEGEGPGEFSSPEDLELTADGRVLVADRDREVEVFRLEGGRLRFVERFPIDVTPWDTCVLDGRLVVQGIRHAEGGGVVHVHDFRGNRLRSFGRLSPGETAIIRETFSWGHVACLPNDRVLYVPRHHDRVALYGLDGNRLWQRKMPGYGPVTVQEQSGGRKSFQWTSPEGNHSALRVVPLPDGRIVAVHLGLRDTTSTGRHDYQGRRTLFFDVASGDIAGESHRVPPFATVARGRIYAVSQIPFPSVTVYSIGSVDR